MRSAISRTQPTWDVARSGISPSTFGMNYAILNNHGGTQILNWLGSAYNATQVDNDLAVLQSVGLTKLRAFMPIESWMDYATGAFTMNTTYKANAHDFLNKANARGISVIVVLSRGETYTTPATLDGQTRWELFLTGAGVTAYTNAMKFAVTELDSHSNILAYEMINEPYGNIGGFSSYAVAQGVTQAQVQSWLSSVYTALKAITTKSVCFSEYEEEEQAKYQIFSNATTRASLVDPYTDIYSMHVYRPSGIYLADFRTLTGKPKWLSEVGAINYSDPSASTHPIAGNNELYDTVKNPPAVYSIVTKALNSGFALVMPWSMGDNASIMTHNGDGSHNLGPIMSRVKGQARSSARSAATTRNAA